MERASRALWTPLLVAAIAGTGPDAWASDARDAAVEPQGHLHPSLDVFVLPTYYRYTESFSSIPVETNWSAPAMALGIDARLDAGIILVPKIGASFLASLSADETNSARLRPSRMRVAHFVDAFPGVELLVRRSRRFTAALSFDWDFVFYEQVRELEDTTASVSEAVFAHGPSAGGRIEGFVSDRIGLAVDYRHVFLQWGSVSNSRFEALGYETPTAHANRDVLRPSVLVRIGEVSFVRGGYRFESIRLRGSTIANGAAEYPDNDHGLHGLEVGFRTTFE